MFYMKLNMRKYDLIKNIYLIQYVACHFFVIICNMY